MNKDDSDNNKETLVQINSDPTQKISPEPKPPEILVDFKPSILVGYTLDERFQIIRDLAENDAADKGGIGLIYLAEDLKLLGKKVVIKILQKEALKSEDIARKFQHEKEALIRLDHPNIVKILDSGILSDGNPYMVMEYIQGCSLRRVLTENKKLSFAFCAHIIESVTNALAAAHSQQILHRDIKPENIMLSPQKEGLEHVRLIDFGIARVENSELAPATQIERGIGTILYIAPEQLLGKLEQTPAADICSFAIVAYEILTGKLPFNPTSPVEMFMLQKEGVKVKPREICPEIPAEAESLILQALSFDPSDRPQDALIFGRKLADVLRKNEVMRQSIGKNRIENSKPTSKNPAFDKNKTEAKEEVSFHDSIKTSTKIQLNVDRTEVMPSDLLKKESRKFSKIPIIFGFGFLILATILSLAGFIWWKNSGVVASNSNIAENSNIEKVAEVPRRELSYYLDVQKMRNGKPYEEPFRASGREIFESGYKFKTVLKSDTDGFLYLFNEGRNEKGKTEYYLLHPTSPEKDSGRIKAGQEIETGYNEFFGGKGTEIIWVIWTKKENETLERAKNAALEVNGGGVTNEEISLQLNDFLLQHTKEKNEIDKDSSKEITVVKAKGDVLIHRLELEHK